MSAPEPEFAGFPANSYVTRSQLEQLERLGSEIPPATLLWPILVIHIRPQIKKKTKSKLQILKTLPKIQILILLEILHVTHFLQWPDTLYKYEMDQSEL